jgi:hypothetical protein
MSLMLKKVKEDAEKKLKHGNIALDGKINKETYLSSMPLTMFRQKSYEVSLGLDQNNEKRP